MRHILHILSQPGAPNSDSAHTFSKTIIEAEKKLSNTKTEIVDLSQKSPDYHTLVQQIFAADSIHVW